MMDSSSSLWGLRGGGRIHLVRIREGGMQESEHFGLIFEFLIKDT